MKMFLLILIVMGAFFVIASGIWVGIILAKFISIRPTASKQKAEYQKQPSDARPSTSDF